MDNHEFLRNLHEIKSLKFGEFTLASGTKSEFYLDLRVIPYHPEYFATIMQNMYTNLVHDLEFDILCGIPSAGVPFATLLAYLSKKSLILLRKEPKKHGLGQLIEGGSVKDKQVLIIDDLISSGHSKEIFINHLRDNGAIVDNLVVIVDRRDKVSKNFIEWEKNMQITVLSLFELSKEQILSFKQESGK